MSDNPATRGYVFSLEKFIAENRSWSRRVFGEGRRTVGVCAHIEKELDEIRAVPNDLEEWIDVIFLALDGAWRAGYEPEDIVKMLVYKQQKNFNRTWPPPPPETEPSMHIKEETDQPNIGTLLKWGRENGRTKPEEPDTFYNAHNEDR